MPAVLHLQTGEETVYELKIVLYFEKLQNPGWFKVNGRGQREAQTRYKVVDADNRVKFLQDCVVRALGIPNDCQIFRTIAEKHEDPTKPRAEITVTVLDEHAFIIERRP